MENAVGNEENKIETRYLAFSLAPEQFAIPLPRVKEVIALPSLTSIPNMPAYFRGLLDLRGQIIPILDLRSKLGLKSVAANAETSVIILDLPKSQVGIVVDSVDHVLNVGPGKLKEVPNILGAVGHHLLGVVENEKSLVLLLDVEKLIDASDRNVPSTQNAKVASR